MTDVERPIFLGTAATDECDGCRKDTEEARATAKWLLPCEHFVCRSCLNKLWISKIFESVPCPVFDCFRETNFLPQPPVQSIRVDRDMMQQADLAQYSTKVLKYPIKAETNEAIYLINELYDRIEDQTLSAESLGSFPAAGDVQEPLLSIHKFFQDPYRPDLVTPRELSQQLREVVNQATLAHTQPIHQRALRQTSGYVEAFKRGDPQEVFKLAKDGIDIVHEEWAVWLELVDKLVGLLTIRHLDRFRTPDDEDQKEE
jgi:hypothetical protein